jgi:transposase
LRDDQWERIKDLLPGRHGSVGVTARDNRLFVEAVYRAGIPWRDLPERFGDFRVVHTRFTRWSKKGLWQQVFEALASDADERVIKKLEKQGKTSVIPPKKNRNEQREYNKFLYQARHLIENFLLG